MTNNKSNKNSEVGAPSNGMKIFITGHKGFIGSHLAAELNPVRDKSPKATAAAQLRISNGIKKNKYIMSGYDIRSDAKDDVRNYGRLREAIRGFRPDGIIHLAAVSRVEDGFLDPKKCVEVNIGSVSNLLEIMREMPAPERPWLIFASSREVFGEPKKMPVVEDSPKNVINIYGVTKLAGEMLIRNYADNYGLKGWVLRFSNVYTGANDRQERVIPTFIRQALANKPITINGGQQVFDFAYIGDTIQGIMKCIEAIGSSGKNFDDFNLTTGRKKSIKELAGLIIELTGSKSRIVFNDPRQYDVNTFWGNPIKPKKVLGWQAKTDLRRGLKEVIHEFKRGKKI